MKALGESGMTGRGQSRRVLKAAATVQHPSRRVIVAFASIGVRPKTRAERSALNEVKKYTWGASTRSISQ